MAKKEHGNIYKNAVKELERAGIKPEGSAATSSIYHTTLKVVDAIEKGSINDFTKGMIKSIAFILADNELINDVTNYGGEWEDISADNPPFETTHRNLRNPKIYSRDGGSSWVRFDGEGRQEGISKDVNEKETTDGSEAKENV